MHALIFISQSHTNTVTVIVAVFRETRKPVKNTVEYAMGEIMVTMAIYKSIKTKQWEKVTLENLIS